MFVQPSDLMVKDLQMKGAQGQHQIPYPPEKHGKAEIPEPTTADN